MVIRTAKVTPFVGVWIETFSVNVNTFAHTVTPFVGVWIETVRSARRKRQTMSHPSWVCGLKQKTDFIF
mgnify:CR=1 FL=1